MFGPLPNWKGDAAPVDGAVEAPKLKPLTAGFEAVPSGVADEKGLLKALFDDPPALKLKLAPPDAGAAGVVEDAEPKLKPPLVLVSAGFEVFPNKLVEPVARGAAPKLKPPGPEVALEVLLLPRENRGFAGDLSSCFIGLPSNMEGADVGGDFGAPKRGFEPDPVVPLRGFDPALDPPKLNSDGAVPEADAVAGASPDAEAMDTPVLPNNVVEGVDEEAPPKRLVDVVGAALAPNRLEDASLLAASDPLLPNAGRGLAGSSDAGFSGSLAASAGLAPKRVVDCKADGCDAAESDGLLARPKRLEAVVDGVVVEEPKRDDALVLLAAGSLAGSAGVAGFCEKREAPKGDCAGGALFSEAGFLDPWESFSLSDSPPSLSVCSAVFSGEGSFSTGLSSLPPPKRFEGAVLLGAKTLEADPD